MNKGTRIIPLEAIDFSDVCRCLSCRSKRRVGAAVERQRGRIQRMALVLLIGVVAAGGVVQAVPSEGERWVADLLRLASLADAAYDAEPDKWPAGRPESPEEAMMLIDEIVQQIYEEGASFAITQPRAVGWVQYPPLRRSAVAGTYSVEAQVVGINVRYFFPAWREHSWLAVLVHELTHAQGFFSNDIHGVGTSEAQTETIATETVAAMANLGYPGMRAELLDGLRRDALAMAYYLARFGGGPIFTTHEAPGRWVDEDEKIPVYDAKLTAQVAQARADVFDSGDLARAEARLRFWEQRQGEYRRVLTSYTVPVLSMILDGACGDGMLSEGFQQHGWQNDREGLLPNPDGIGYTWGPIPGGWSEEAITNPPLVVDDLAYVLRDELEYC